MFLSSLLLILNLSCATSLNPNNIKLDLIVPDGPHYAGEIVFLEARLTNISSVPINIPIQRNDTFSWNFDIRVYESDKEYSICATHFDRRDGDVFLAPGGVHVYRMPLYLCTKRNFDTDRRFRAKAVYWSKDGDPHSVLESQEQLFDVLAPKRDEDREAYRMIYPAVGAALPEAYGPITAYKKVPDKFPTSIYVKYALFAQGKSEIELDATAYIPHGIETLERLLREYPVFHLTDETLYYLGLAHLRLGESPKALELYNKVIQEFPNTEGADMASKALQGLNSTK